MAGIGIIDKDQTIRSKKQKNFISSYNKSVPIFNPTKNVRGLVGP
jgi:hypothetical protein